MASTFKNAPSTGSQTITSTNQASPDTIYGPVPAATTAVVFDGTVANTDTSGLADQVVTVSIKRSGGTYDVTLQTITIPFGSSFQLPKMVLMTGEYLCMNASVSGKLAAKIHLVELS